MSANQPSMDVLFRVDATPEIGSGHFMRCLALAQAMVDAGLRVSWLAAELPAHLRQLLVDEGIDLRQLQVEVGGDEDALQTVEQCKASGARWVVLDGYRFGEGYRNKLAQSGSKLLWLDDQGTAEDLHADLLLNQNLHASEQLYPRRSARTKLLVGCEYVLLRRSLRLATPRTPEQRSRGRHLLVIAGGSDPSGLTARVLDALAAQPLDVEITVVLGSRQGTARIAEVEQRTQQLMARLLVDVKDMAAVLDQADLAISAAGSTTWELMRFGIPSLIVPVADNQRPIASGAGAAGVARDLGWHGELYSGGLLSYLRGLAEDRDQRQEMGERARKLVDGQGYQRVITAMGLAGACAP